MDDDLADVIPLPSARPGIRSKNQLEGRLDELTVRTERPAPTTCQHRRSAVNEEARTLRCRDCNTDLDPIDVLARLSRRRESEILQARRMRLELDALQEQTKQAQREERNAKARTRRVRAGRSDEAAIVAAAEAMSDGRLQASGYYRDEMLRRARRTVEAYHAAVEREGEQEVASSQ